LRGIAILAVLAYHCRDKMTGTPLYSMAQWGWAGVDLFFVLSGFLITGILIESRTKPHYFRNFYLRRFLRIWPVYLLMLGLTILTAPRYIGPTWRSQLTAMPWYAYLLLLQNLFRAAMPGGLGPTWSLAIEEQYYLAWAPLTRWMRSRALLAGLLGVVLAASPLLRMRYAAHLPATHTLLHLDGIAIGSLLGIALHTWQLSRSHALQLAATACTVGVLAGVWLSRWSPPFLDSALALLFAGLVMAAVVGSGGNGLYQRLLRMRVLRFYGRISYGLYMTHIFVFVVIGQFDAAMEPHGIPGGLAIVAARVAVTTLVATALWYGFERPILGLKSRLANGERKSADVLDASVSRNETPVS
jgi:peptidoglycan/LPS O-acetylase OafA/YrhL